MNTGVAKEPAESIDAGRCSSSFRPAAVTPQTSWESNHGSFPFLCFLHTNVINQFWSADEKDRSICPDQSPEDNISSGTIQRRCAEDVTIVDYNAIA